MINIKTDSRKVIPGDIFVAIKGHTVDGHDFIDAAIENGAVKIVAEHGNYGVQTEIVSDTKEYIKEILKSDYKYVTDELKFVGVTGTNGKTTTSFIVHQMLEQLGEVSAYIGTIGFFVNGEFVRELPNTTPEIIEMYNLILEAKERGAKVIVLEASSHALEEGRLEGIEYEVGAFTNLTQDHLDFHKTMDNYLESKKKLVQKLVPNGVMVVNADDDCYESFCTAKHITIGNNGIDYKFENFNLKQGNTEINFSIADGSKYTIETNFTGSFNVYNYMMATAIIVELGYKLDDVLKLADKIYPPKGRCHTILVKGAQVVIDFAHTPDAVEKIMECFTHVKTNRIITIIGCGGDRDATKRPIMGNLATSNSDFVIFTNDNPRTEDEVKIMDDILKGVMTDNYKVIYDRRKAIEEALDMLNTGDILLVLGKGHENYQVIGHEKIHSDDAEIVEEYLKKLSN